MRNFKIVVVSLALLLLSSAGWTQDAKWESLFDGKSLNGWHVRGGCATYQIENGEIVGTTIANEPNSFLCTDKEYGNFVLKFEFKVDEGLNSGVMFRAVFSDGLVRGYQYEIDPDKTTKYSALPRNKDANGKEIAAGVAPRSWTGGIYDEKRRGWIGDLTNNPEARNAFKPKEWNEARIEAKGDLLKTYINGVHAATVVDYMTPNGFIGLQVHAVPEFKEMQVRFRNIEIQDLGLNPEEGDVIDVNLSEWKDSSTGWLGQIWYDRKNATYKLNLSDVPYANKEPMAVLEGKLSDDGTLKFSNVDGLQGRIEKKRLIVEGGEINFKGQKIVRVPPTLGLEAPKNAIVLFDGSDLKEWASLAPKEWVNPSGDASDAVILRPGGRIEMVPGNNSIITHKTFGDCHLHLEYRLLGEVTNGGVYLQSRYEFNIKDSWGQGKGSPTGAWGNISEPQYPDPDFNYALPPMSWQTMDIDFQAPRFDSEGNKVSNAKATLYVNGELVYKDAEVERLKGAAGRLGEAALGPVYLQEHGTAYQFRNIWIIDKTK